MNNNPEGERIKFTLVGPDPAKLGDALLQIADMKNPPKIFAAGSDALETIVPAVEARLHDLRANDSLSRSAGGF